MKTTVACALALTLGFTGLVTDQAEARRLGKPDLITSAVSGPSSVAPGATIVVSSTINNQGSAGAKTFRLAHYLSTSPSSTTDATVLGMQDVTSLAAGASVALVTTFAVPESTTSGTHYVVTVADVTRVITESNESNNTRASGAITVQDVTPPTISGVTTSGNAALSADYTFTTTTALPAATGTLYYVATTGNDGNPGTDVSPFRTINKGVSVLAPGDTLYIKSGTYAESLINKIPGGTSWSQPVTVAAYPSHTVRLRPNSGSVVVELAGASRAYIILNRLILDATNVADNVVEITSGAHHIRIQNSYLVSSQGNGLYVRSSSANEFINLGIHHNGTSSLDHGIYLSQDAKRNVIRQSRVYSNAGYGIHLYHSNGGVDYNYIRNNYVYNNGQRGIILGSGKGNLAYNNVLWGNQQGGIIVEYGAAVTNTGVYNNTLYANVRYGIRVGAASAGAVIRNNIIYQNGTNISNAGSGTVLDHNLVGIDPRFVNAAGGDFHLQAGSPAIDTGVTVSAVTFDFDAIPRPQGAAYNIGAFE